MIMKKERDLVIWFINHVYDRPLDPKLTFFTDKANFNVSGYANSQNNMYWSS
jgi:hypothetical protein